MTQEQSLLKEACNLLEYAANTLSMACPEEVAHADSNHPLLSWVARWVDFRKRVAAHDSAPANPAPNDVVRALEDMTDEVERNAYVPAFEHMGPWVIAARRALAAASVSQERNAVVDEVEAVAEILDRLADAHARRTMYGLAEDCLAAAKAVRALSHPQGVAPAETVKCAWPNCKCLKACDGLASAPAENAHKEKLVHGPIQGTNNARWDESLNTWVLADALRRPVGAERRHIARDERRPHQCPHGNWNALDCPDCRAALQEKRHD